mmetsp:Transcript_64815/g.74486  ORF Transcript_64815/g.74486 Transcript_64815/m.74486 type:complete len:200 (+) Transcript_64815:130-729(+)
MSSTTGSIHQSGADGTIGVTLFHFCFDGGVRVHRMLRQTFYENSHNFGFSDLQTSFSGRILAEQISDTFIINFKHGETDLVTFVRIVILLDTSENVCCRDGDNTLIGSIANHGVTLPRPCLTISEQTAMVTFPSIVQNFHTQQLEYFGLINIFVICGMIVPLVVGSKAVMRPETMIEGEILGFSVGASDDCGVAFHGDG